MKKGFDSKKGQGLPISTLILMIIGGVVLISVIIGFTTGWGYIFGKLGMLPDDLTTAALACSNYASPDLKLSYCEYRELRIEGKKGYYNCDAIRDAVVKVTPDIEWTKLGCNNLAKEFCVNNNLKNSTVIQNTTCKALLS